jgi:hypothetical protein
MIHHDLALGAPQVAMAKPGFARRSQNAGRDGNPFRVSISAVCLQGRHHDRVWSRKEKMAGLGSCFLIQSMGGTHLRKT